MEILYRDLLNTIQAEKEISSRLEILYWVLPFGGLLYIVVSFIRLGRKA